MANELYRTYEVLVEESIHPKHPKRAKDKDGKLLKTDKPERFNAEIDGALRDTHMIFQDAVCYNTLCFAGLAGTERHKSGERAGELLNPLWEHLTKPASQGGINEETKRVILRLATHYKPLEGVTTADEFLNRVYSEPLQIRDEMPEAEKAHRREMRAKCYRILEKFGTKDGAGEECEDMAAFKNNWAGLMSDEDSEAEIPGNGAYDLVWRELKESLAKVSSDAEASKILEKTLNKYSETAEKQNREHCERSYGNELLKRKQAAEEAEQLPDSDKKKAATMKRVRAAVEKWVKGKPDYEKEFFEDRRAKLADAVIKAFAKPFEAKEAAEIGVSESEFVEARKRAQVLAATEETRAKTHIRLHYKGGATGNFEKAMFRYWVMREDTNAVVRKVALADFRKFITDNTPKDEPKLDEVPFKEMPFAVNGTKIAFPYFGKKCLGIPTTDSSPDPEFDKIAFATAAEDVFKYKIRTDKRGREIAQIGSIVGAFEGKGLDAEHSPTGNTIRGMKDDPRWKCEDESKGGIVQLLKKLSEGKEIVSYGLREGTIGGWAEVRKSLLAVHRKMKRANDGNRDGSAMVTALTNAVDIEMEANRQGFGSADFFHALCAPEYHHLWLDSAECVRNEINDFIPHYVTYCEHREDLIELLRRSDGAELDWGADLSDEEQRKLIKKPIRYTWPGLLNRHKNPSFRYYDFTAKLAVRLPLQLFRRVRPEDDPKSIDCYKLIPGKQAVLTLAARRLKRDKIINKSKETGAWSSVDALWCPPLILEGESSPTSDTKPIAGKKKKVKADEAEVSFSLIAAPLPGDYWNTVTDLPPTKEAEPVHLTVSFKIEGDETAKLRAETKQWLSGSHRGFAKKGDKDADKRRCFNWPIDRDTSKFDSDGTQEKAKVLWCGSGKAGEAWKGFAFRHDKKASGTKDSAYHEPDFQILSIDLGNRFAAAFTRLRIHADAGGSGRVISADGFLPTIKAEVTREGTLRLQGENAKVWGHLRNDDGTCKRDAKGNYVYALEDEKYGNGGRGRFPTDEEYGKRFAPLAERLVPASALTLAGKEQTYPELGDHLVFRLKRRIGRLRTLFNLAWRLCAKHERNQQTGTQGKERSETDQQFHRQVVIETLARSAFPKRPRQPGEQEEPGDKSLRTTLATEEQWQKLKADKLLDSAKGAAEQQRQASLNAALKDSAVWKWDALAGAVKEQIEEYVEGVPGDSEKPPLHELLVAVIEFCLPLRGRHWGWDSRRQARLHWDNKDEEHKPNIMGMRGLSMKRLEQILNLRQRCQSFAKLENRYYGPYKTGNYNPPDSNRDELPDCCPLLLERSNRIREQRVDQTAHLILAEALGMELKNPADVVDKKTRKAEVDLHGEYQRRKDKHGKPYPRCSVIVLENLERYKTSQERTKMENSRLMKWAHRAIIEKLEDMCRPFGITLMLVDPAFSSHFDSRTGLPGVRVNQVARGFENEYPYNRWIEGKNKAGKDDTQLAKDIKALVKTFAEHPEYTGELILAAEGGKEFMPVAAPPSGNDGPINADVCAAGNIGLRGIADPQRWDIFPRLRTKQVSENEVSVLNWRGWFGKFPTDLKDKKSEGRRMKAVASAGASAKSSASPSASTEGADNVDSQSSQSSEYPWFFVEHPSFPRLNNGDWLAKAAYEFAQGGMTLRAFPQGAFLKRVELLCGERIKEINRARIQQWERKGDDVPM